MDKLFAKRMDELVPSGIRKVNEKALAMERAGETVIHFELGRPDYDTPEYIKNACIEDIKKGDVFYLHVYDRVLAYEVDNIAIVEPNDYGLLEIEEGKDLCTLFTCTPYGINTQRLLVRGHRIENTLEDANLTSDAAKVNSLVVASCIGVVILCVGFIIGKLRKKGR